MGIQTLDLNPEVLNLRVPLVATVPTTFFLTVTDSVWLEENPDATEADILDAPKVPVDLTGHTFKAAYFDAKTSAGAQLGTWPATLSDDPTDGAVTLDFNLTNPLAKFWSLWSTTDSVTWYPWLHGNVVTSGPKVLT